MSKKRTGLLATLLMILSMVASACGGGSQATATPKPAGTSAPGAPTSVPAVATVQATTTPLPATPTPNVAGATDAERFAALEGKVIVTNDGIKNAKYGGTLQITSGSVGEPQLHFELRQGTRSVDPTRYLSGQGISSR